MITLHRLTAAAVVLTALALPTVAVTASPAAAAVTHRVLITGDSITQGSSGDYTWRYRLWNKLASTAPGAASFVGTRTDLYDNVNQVYGSQHYAASFTAKAHAAKWGDTYINELGSIASQVTSSNANTLVVMLGSNDLAYHTSPAETVANVKTYIQRARAAKPGIDVVVGEVVRRYDPWAGAYTLTSETADYATKVRALATSLNTSSERVVVAPTRNGWDAKIHTWDGTHPNPTGEKLIAQRVSEGLASIGLGASSPSIMGTTAWNVAGPAVSLSPGSEAAQLSWSRTSTGALSMFVEQRLTNIDGAWDRLPYAVTGDGWNAEVLAAGGTYQFRVAPSKGWSTGTVGPASSVTATGPTPGAVTDMNASAGGSSDLGGETAQTSWPAAANASGYKLASRVMSNGDMSWVTLPYAISDRRWVFEPLLPGRRYQFRVTPVRGFLEGSMKASAVTRLSGLPGDRVYVALGDSYSAGLGSSGEYNGGDCNRSAHGWTWQLQTPFNFATRQLACSGAVISGPSGDKAVVNQLPQMEDIFDAFPGKPQLITLTVGGNDVGFTGLIGDCVFGSACTNRESEKNAAIDALETSLNGLYDTIRRDAPYADVMVGGYPAVLEVGGPSNNALCLLIGDNERAMASRLSQRLNDRIASAAAAAGVWSVGQNLVSRFDGHAACAGSTGEWIHAGKGDLGGEHGVASVESFHPNDGGQFQYALVFSDTLVARSR